MSGSFRVPQTQAWTGGPYANGYVQVVLPPTLIEWLIDLCLLRTVPVHYLLPDPRLLPPESARYVSLDANRVTRLIDGALSAVSLGAGDVAITAQYRTGVLHLLAREVAWRAHADQHPLTDDNVFVDARKAFAMHWEEIRKATPRPPPQGPWEGQVAGILIRSELVRRYPSMIVRAARNQATLGAVRRELLAPGVLLVLFHSVDGLPDLIELQEPDEGLRFGVEPVQAVEPFELATTGGLRLDFRTVDGADAGTTLPVTPRAGGDGTVLRIGDLAKAVGNASLGGADGPPLVDSPGLARCLQQPPFIQQFGTGRRPDTWRV